jgi:hypothetical protein
MRLLNCANDDNSRLNAPVAQLDRVLLDEGRGRRDRCVVPIFSKVTRLSLLGELPWCPSGAHFCCERKTIQTERFRTKKI